MKTLKKRRGTLAILGVVLVFGTLLVGCSAQDEGTSNVPNIVTTRPTEEASGTETSPPLSNNEVVQTAAVGIDESSIRTNLAHLTGASPAPLTTGPTTITERGSEDGRRAAAEYMKQSFEDMGIPVRILEFTSGTRRGFNVEATLQGTEGEKHLWMTAHLDSVFNAGAEDDASGLVSILLTAKALKQLNPKHTVHFVAYDLEEIGTVGSTIYVGSIVSAIRQQEGDRAIIGDLHSDMIGYDEEGGFVAVMGTCNRAGSIDEAILRASEMIDSPLHLRDDCLRRSDHEHFWDAGLPAVLMVDGAKYDYYPWYHDPGDTLDKLNIPYLRSVIQLNAATAALLVAPES